MENNLPVGWQSAKLSQIVEYKKGKKPKRLESEPFQDSLTYLDIRAIEKNVNEIFADPGSSSISDTNELVIVWDGARAGWVGLSRVGAVGSTLMALRPKIDKLFLYRFLQYQFDYLHSNHRGTGIPHVDPDILWNIDVPIPSLNEQQRIVSKLNSLFEKLETNKKRLEKIPQILKRFRQSVLADAVSGNLTEDWREKQCLGSEWALKKLGDCGSITGGLTLNSKRELYQLKMPYLRVGNVYSNRIILDVIKTIGVAENEINRTLLCKDDLLIVEGNGSADQIGRVAQWNEEIPNCLHQNHLIKFRSNHVNNPRYILYFLLSIYGREQIEEANKSTSGLYTLSLSKVSGLSIPIPSLEEQNEIVNLVERLLLFADKIESRYLKAKAQLDKLPQSILAKAFRGELVPKDLEDEPANLLLERILTTRRIKK
jgi:type I restriction enzyme, S subunit